MPDAKTEVEMKFLVRSPKEWAALPAVLARLSHAVGTPLTHVCRDRYLDTRDHWLMQAGVACRLRLRGDKAELALKTLSAPQEGLASRLECEETLAGAPAGFPGRLPGRRIRDWLAPLMDDRTVRVLFTLRQSRTVYYVQPRSGVVLQVSADTVTVEGRPSAAPRHELEVELQRGEPDDLLRFARKLQRRLPLKPCRDSKFEFGLAAAGLKLCAPPPCDLRRLRPSASFIVLAHQVLERNYRQLRWNEAGTLVGLDPERLHAMRVAARRMRAALRTFRHALSPATERWLTRELRWVAQGLGRVRDLDVYLETLQADIDHLPEALFPALDDYRKCIRREREVARRAMLHMLLSSRYAAFRQRADEFFALPPGRQPAGPWGRTRVAAVAPGLVRKALKKLLKDGRRIHARSPDTDLHALRIRCKRLRYVCEFLTAVYDEPAERLGRKIAALQDVLGAHQDATVAQQLINKFVAGELACQPSSERQHFALGQLMTYKSGQARKCRRAFHAAWERFDRRKVRQPLQKKLKRLAAEED